MRCVSCDNILKESEEKWYPRENRLEDMCTKCLVKSRPTADLFDDYEFMIEVLDDDKE